MSVRRVTAMTPGGLGRACLLVAVAAVANASGARESASDPQKAAAVATPLRTSKTVLFADGEWLGWKHPAVCDAEGNVFLVPVPKADPRDLRVPAEERRHMKKPSDILRISADGKKKTILELAGVATLADADEVTTITINSDPNGILHALVWAARGEKDSVYLVSFREDGTYKSRLEISQEELVPQRFEFFGSGAVLLTGFRPHEGPRAAVMPASGGSFRDVSGLEVLKPGAGDVSSRTEETEDRSSGPTTSDLVTRGGDGRIYMVPGAGKSVYVIDESGESRPAFELSPLTGLVARNSHLVDVKGSGQHLAAIYYEDRGDDRARFWITIYDVSLGERVALYGPVEGMPFCYAHEEGQDRFTVVKDARYFVTLSSP